MKETSTSLEECPGCRVDPGGGHGDECDHAWCPDCGEQLFLHVCERWDDDADGPDRPALWHGVDQRAQVARQRSWWTTAVGIDHLVEDYSRVLFAIGPGQITWDPRFQTYAIGRIDEAALDRAIANSTFG
jgi:hypothetical protein